MRGIKLYLLIATALLMAPVLAACPDSESESPFLVSESTEQAIPSQPELKALAQSPDAKSILERSRAEMDGAETYALALEMTAEYEMDQRSLATAVRLSADFAVPNRLSGTRVWSSTAAVSDAESRFISISDDGDEYEEQPGTESHARR